MSGDCICLVTPAHLAHNPRLVKEADALSAAGHAVEVVACQYMPPVVPADEELLRHRRWKARFVCYSRSGRPALFWWSRMRQHACRQMVRRLAISTAGGRVLPVVLRAAGRVVPELERAAAQTRARLFIAHNLEALPAAIRAAQRTGGRVMFDAEDFHSGMASGPQRLTSQLAGLVERTYLPACAGLTAASGHMADSYARTYGLARPTPVYNVFPLAQRPPTFRATPRTGPVRLYWFSRTIGANRGLEDVVQAMGLAGRRGLELHLRGDWQPGYAECLRALARRCGLADEQVQAHPFAGADDMVRLAASCEVGLALEPGRDENNRITISNKFFTCLLAGNALVATNTPGQLEAAAQMDGVVWVYSPGQITALADQLRCWHDHRDALDAARQQAWAWGGRRFNWEAEQHKFLGVVAQVLAGGPRC